MTMDDEHPEWMRSEKKLVLQRARDIKRELFVLCPALRDLRFRVRHPNGPPPPPPVGRGRAPNYYPKYSFNLVVNSDESAKRSMRSLVVCRPLSSSPPQ